MDAGVFVETLERKLGVGAYYGVPDSLLRSFTDEVVERYGFGPRHVVAADEGGAAALAAGRYLATGERSVVYLQNSGIGNAVNPICSLLNEEVYAIPALFVVGWRGEPGVHDEPQHVFQGACSIDLLESVGLSVDVISSETSVDDLLRVLEAIANRFEKGQSAALLIKKGALTRDTKHSYTHDGPMTRERAVEVASAELPAGCAIVSTTGKLSRELFEIREHLGQSHESDFLTVGSMGHSSRIGLGIALAQPKRTVAVFDGDGACIMHTGALAVLANCAPDNLVHILFNNEAHESVGGMPTASGSVDWPAVARALCYKNARTAQSEEELVEAIRLSLAEGARPAFIEVKTDASSRADLGRPTSSAYDNGKAFQAFLAR